MKFETKLTKYEIDENEVKSIIANCFCGEINGAYLIDLTKIRKMEIMEVIGNYLDTDKLDFDVRFKTFLKTYEITEEEVADLFVEGFNEGGCDIAYRLESNKDVILVLTDDERYNNSFISYAPSQTGEIDQYEKEMEELEAEYIRLGELEPTREPLQIFEGETEDVPTTKTCRVILRNRGAKYYCRYNDLHKLTESEIEFLNRRNTNKNIIQKLELLYEKESLEDAFEDFCPGSQHGNLRNLLAELKEIKERNGKINISKDFKYTIEITIENES